MNGRHIKKSPPTKRIAYGNPQKSEDNKCRPQLPVYGSRCHPMVKIQSSRRPWICASCLVGPCCAQRIERPVASGRTIGTSARDNNARARMGRFIGRIRRSCKSCSSGSGLVKSAASEPSQTPASCRWQRPLQASSCRYCLPLWDDDVRDGLLEDPVYDGCRTAQKAMIDEPVSGKESSGPVKALGRCDAADDGVSTHQLDRHHAGRTRRLDFDECVTPLPGVRRDLPVFLTVAVD